MVEATEIEKKSLEAHVELCAERYNALEDKLAIMSENIAKINFDSLSVFIIPFTKSLSRFRVIYVE